MLRLPTPFWGVKYFTSKNIIMEGGRITAIDGLLYNKSDNMYTIDPKLTNKRPVKKVKTRGYSTARIIRELFI